jgi:hypothetical protein
MSGDVERGAEQVGLAPDVVGNSGAHDLSGAHRADAPSARSSPK